MNNMDNVVLGKRIGMGILALTALVIVMSSFYVIDQSERGVVLRNGAYVEIADPGLHFKLPIIDSVKVLSIQQRTSLYNSVPAYSSDQQPATMSVSITWQPDVSKLKKLYEDYKDIETMEARLVTRNVGNAVENTFGTFTAANAVNKRGVMVSKLNEAFVENADGPIIIVSTQLENIDFEDAYEQVIATRMAAEVAVTTRKQQLETEKVQAEIAVTQAQAAADSQLARAEADAKAVRLRGEAEAYAIEAKAKALATNTNLIELTKAERWDGKVPTTMLPNSTIPFLSK